MPRMTCAGLGGLRRLAWLALLTAAGAIGSSAQEARLIVSVLDERTGETALGLRASDFSARDGDTPLRVLAARELEGPVDIALLVDASMAGEPTRPIAEALIEALEPAESMALVGYHDSADLLQDFTSDAGFLQRALNRVEYGNVPRIHDALFAVVDGAFEASGGRRTVLVVSSGLAARSRTAEGEVLSRARAKQVSIHAVFVRNDARSLFRRLTRRTGGASFAAKRLGSAPRQLARQILAAVRHPYELTVSGVYNLGDRIEVTVAGAKNLTASVLPVD